MNFQIEIYRYGNRDLIHKSDEDLLYHFECYGKEEGRIHNIETFYQSYKNEFDLDVYKKCNMDLQYINEIEYIIHFLKNGKEESRISCLKMLKEKNSDYSFEYDRTIFRYTNQEYIDYSDEELDAYFHENISNNIHCIYNEKTFLQHYPYFNFDIIRLCNPELEKKSDLDIIYYFLSNGMYENRIYTIQEFIHNQKRFNIDIFRVCNIDLKNKSMIELIKIYLNKNNTRKYILTENDFYEMYPDYNEMDIHLSQPLLIYQEKWKKFEYYLNNEFVKKDFFLKKYPLFDFDFYDFIYLKKESSDATYIIKDFLQNMDNYYSVSHFYESNPQLQPQYLEFNYSSNNPYEIILQYIQDTKKKEKIYSDSDFLKRYCDFDTELYCHLYEVNSKQNQTCIYLNYISSLSLGENRIYSLPMFYTLYPSFDKTFYENVYDCYEREIVYYYFKNPQSFLNRSMFDVKYPDFDILFYKGLHMEINKMYSSYEIIRHFLNNTHKFTLIYNKNIFNTMFSSFDVEFYGEIQDIDFEDPLTVYRHFICNEYSIYNISQFYKKYPYFDYEFYSMYQDRKSNERENIIHYLKNPIKYTSLKLFYQDFPFFETDFYLKRLKYSQMYMKTEISIIIYFLQNHAEDEKYIYSSKQFYEYYPSFSISLYKKKYIELKNISDHDIMVHYLEIGIHENEQTHEKKSVLFVESNAKKEESKLLNIISEKTGETENTERVESIQWEENKAWDKDVIQKDFVKTPFESVTEGVVHVSEDVSENVSEDVSENQEDILDTQDTQDTSFIHKKKKKEKNKK
jgi:hypothetical protein